MKYFAAVLLLATVVCAEWTTKSLPDLLAARTACVTKHNVPDDALEKYKAWTFPEDDLTRAYVTCIFKEFGLFCDHEGFHVDRLVLQFKTAHGLDVQPKVEDCATKRAEDTTNELWVFRAFKCFTAEHLPLVRAQLTKAN
ncbi:General odorant-binding protein 99a [Pseudolycoriella hygida]|uniref:General odorant-binding protein 99a n=1 Tax=Pseudolycoriella hygida TaxID=35572 RepID=A0A9Q0RYZ7_9DIPT|nr:General odorant-binding protein 99a [Pseudolycoriella hygida]